MWLLGQCVARRWKTLSAANMEGFWRGIVSARLFPNLAAVHSETTRLQQPSNVSHLGFHEGLRTKRLFHDAPILSLAVRRAR